MGKVSAPSAAASSFTRSGVAAPMRPSSWYPGAPMSTATVTVPSPHIPPEDHIFVDNVKKSFGSTQVLKGITMHLRRRETAVIIGGSGAGKTTLLRMLIGLEQPTTGHIWVDGDDIA